MWRTRFLHSNYEGETPLSYQEETIIGKLQEEHVCRPSVNGWKSGNQSAETLVELYLLRRLNCKYNRDSRQQN